MYKNEAGLYVLRCAELSALTEASISQATKQLHMPTYDQNNSPLPYFVDRAYQLLHGGARIYTDEQLAGALVINEQEGKLLDNGELYRAVADAIKGGVKEVHAVYAPENNTINPGWLSAAVDLFRHGQTYRVYFSHDGNNQIRIEHLERWYFG